MIQSIIVSVSYFHNHANLFLIPTPIWWLTKMVFPVSRKLEKSTENRRQTLYFQYIPLDYGFGLWISFTAEYAKRLFEEKKQYYNTKV